MAVAERLLRTQLRTELQSEDGRRLCDSEGRARGQERLQPRENTEDHIEQYDEQAVPAADKGATVDAEHEEALAALKRVERLRAADCEWVGEDALGALGLPSVCLRPGDCERTRLAVTMSTPSEEVGGCHTSVRNAEPRRRPAGRRRRTTLSQHDQ